MTATTAGWTAREIMRERDRLWLRFQDERTGENLQAVENATVRVVNALAHSIEEDEAERHLYDGGAHGEPPAENGERLEAARQGRREALAILREAGHV